MSIPRSSLRSRGSDPRFEGVHLRWRVLRTARFFKVGVVEPMVYDPASHEELFYSIVTAIVSPAQDRQEKLHVRNRTLASTPFDLITFPEAFVPADALIEAIKSLRTTSPTNCFHVGLRPSSAEERHLFTVEELQQLLQKLDPLADEHEDYSAFRAWLERQPDDDVFNVGALFAVDADGRMRVCLHPKIVRARVEVSPFNEGHMAEADLLTLVTLIPSDPQLLTVTIQPLVCSDVLDIQTDRPEGTPLKAVTVFADCFKSGPPDHIDIISVATCTPQRRSISNDESEFGEWPEQFRRAFENAANGGEYPRHHFSAFVLANFRTLDKKKGTLGGLSGVFLPVPPGEKAFHRDVIVSAFGRPKNDNGSNNWSRPDDDAQKNWSCRGFIAGLDPFADPPESPVRMLSFHIHRLPREHSFWDVPPSLTKCAVQVSHRDDNGLLQLRARIPNHV